MNAVQIIHKHIMLRFCVVLLAVFVAFGAFTSTCFADDPLGRQITVAVGGTIGSGLGSLAGGSIAAAGVSAVGLPAAAPIASKVGSGLVGSAGGVVGGLFAGKLYDFLTGYDGDADSESFDTAYSEFVSDNSISGSYDSTGRYVVHFTANRDYVSHFNSMSSSSVFEYFSTGVLPADRYTIKGNLSVVFGSIRWISCKFGTSDVRYNFSSPLQFGVSYDSPFSEVCNTSVTSARPYLVFYISLELDDTYSSSICSSIYSSLCSKTSDFYAISNSVHNINSNHVFHVGSASSAVGVSRVIASAIGTSNDTIGCIDTSTPDTASNFYLMPLVDEDNKNLVLPDGSVIDFDDFAYDNDTRTYYITYDTSKTYQITYNYNNCVVNNGSTSNIYYYATVGANTPTYDKDGNQTGGSITDPDNPDTPSGGSDDDSGSIWDKVVDAIAGLFTAIGKVIGGLLESVINLFTGIVDGLTGCLDLFGSFGEFVAGFYTWMPEEWRTILAAAFTIFIGLAVVKLFRGS